MAVFTGIQRQRHISLWGERMGKMRLRGAFAIPAHYAFAGHDSNGWMARIMIIWIAGAIATYLIAVYSLFGLGVTIQQKMTELKNLTEANTISELNLGQQQTAFAKNNEDILQSMEKITNIRYLMPADTSLSQADISPTN